MLHQRIAVERLCIIGFSISAERMFCTKKALIEQTPCHFGGCFQAAEDVITAFVPINIDFILRKRGLTQQGFGKIQQMVSISAQSVETCTTLQHTDRMLDVNPVFIL